MPDSSQVIERMLEAKRIAIVGLSANPERTSHRIAQYLLSVGKEIVPVNPNVGEVFGLRCYPSLRDVPGKIDLVNVFRRSDACEEIVREAIAVKAGGVWLQSGVINEKARRLAEEARMPFVQDVCLMVEHANA